METDQIVPKETVLNRLGRLIDRLNDYNHRVTKLLDETEVSCIGPFAIPGWPKDFLLDIRVKKVVFFPSPCLKGIQLNKVLVLMRVSVGSEGYLNIFAEREKASSGFFRKEIEMERLGYYHSSPRYSAGVSSDINWMEDNTPQEIACCLIVFCQIIDEFCEAVETEIQKRSDKINRSADQCRNIPTLVKRCFEPLIPFIVAETLAQDQGA